MTKILLKRHQIHHENFNDTKWRDDETAKSHKGPSKINVAYKYYCLRVTYWRFVDRMTNRHRLKKVECLQKARVCGDAYVHAATAPLGHSKHPWRVRSFTSSRKSGLMFESFSWCCLVSGFVRMWKFYSPVLMRNRSPTAHLVRHTSPTPSFYLLLVCHLGDKVVLLL